MTPAFALVYKPSMDIRNLDALPRGTGAPYLLVLKSHEPGVYIAVGWKRRASQPPEGYELIAFE